MSRARALQRIAKLYGVVEEMHSVALRQATAAVIEAEQRIHLERGMGLAALAAGREALGAGAREEWLLSHAQGEMAEVRVGLIDGLRVRRVEVESVARDEFLESRVKTEQMKQVVRRMVEQAEVEEGRRVQAASDDRHAARKAWLATRRRA